jgi:ribulose-phosphate 3-epimerase
VLEVDGGVNEATVADVVRAGAELIVAGSAIFNGRESVSDAMQRLRRAIEQASERAAGA